MQQDLVIKGKSSNSKALLVQISGKPYVTPKRAQRKQQFEFSHSYSISLMQRPNSYFLKHHSRWSHGSMMSDYRKGKGFGGR